MLDLLFLLAILLVPFLIGVYLMMKGPGAEAVIGFVRRSMESGLLARTVGVTFVVGTVTLIAWGVVRARATPAAWQEFATRNGLTFLAPPDVLPPGRVRGERNGRAVELGLKSRADLHGRDRRSWMELSVEVRGAPEQLSVVPRMDLGFGLDGLKDAMANAVGAPSPIPTQDAAFDDAFTVHGADGAVTLAWLTATRRAAITEFLSEDGWSVQNGALTFQSWLTVTKVRVLEERFERLESFAARLEATASR